MTRRSKLVTMASICLSQSLQSTEAAMQVSDGMSAIVLSIGPSHTVREAAAAMSSRHVGAAGVLDPDAPGPGMITERDVLRAVGAGLDPDRELVSDHLSAN